MEYSEKLAKVLTEKYSLKASTLERWQKQNFIPDKYGEEKTSSFKICGLTLKECRTKLGKDSTEVIEDILKKTGFRITNTSFSQWENGVVEPRQNYKNILTTYYERELQEKEL
jgi:hypothetical protein